MADRIGLFGGAFDPVHMGHLDISEVSIHQLRLDRLFFIPSGIPPHRPLPVAPPEDRLAMLSLVMDKAGCYRISDFELKKGAEITYTFQTVAEFRKVYPSAELFFIMGSDSLAEIELWRSWKEMLEHACIVAGLRPGSEIPELDARIKEKVIILKNRRLSISSSEIRKRLREKKGIKGLVSQEVEVYIKEKGLYLS